MTENTIISCNTTNVTVRSQAVDIALGEKEINPSGVLIVKIGIPIPTGTEGKLPVNLIINGDIRPLTFFNGTDVTTSDISGTGVLFVYYDKYNGILQLLSTPVVTE